MEIISVDFENNMVLELNGVKISIHPFKESDPNIIKLGVDAPKSILVNREEIHEAKKRLGKSSNTGERVVGYIKSYDPGKGVGFAKVKHTADDVLISHSNIVGRKGGYNLWEGDKVSMVVKKSPDGLVAEEVEIL